MIASVLTVIVPVIALIGIGMLLRNRGFVSEHGITEMKFLVMNFCMPAALLRNFITTTLTAQDGILLLVMSCSMAATFVLGFVMRRLLRIREEVASYLCCTVEGGCIAIVFFSLLFGQTNLYKMALFDAGGALFQWPVIMTLYARMQSGKKSTNLLGSLKMMINPVIISIFLGVFLSATGLGPELASILPGQVLVSILDSVSAPTGPLIIITIGYGIVLKGLPWKALGKGIAARIITAVIVGTVVYYIVSGLFPDDPLYRYAVLLYYTAPPTFVYSAMARREEDKSYVGTYLAIYTLLSVIAFMVITVIVR